VEGQDADVEALVVRAQAGEVDAFEQLAAQQLAGLYRAAVALVGADDAGDLAQEALVAAWRELPRLRDPARFRAWLHRILVNRSRNHLRAQRRRPQLTLDVLARDPSGPSPSDPAIFLSAAVAELPTPQRLAVSLHYFGGLSLREVGAVLGVPESTVKSRLHVARGTLRVALEG
jgi:RNA polymerase sigma-70 factor (ECF subfamily)